ncbi:MAG: hypothetical protein MUC72_04005 [Acidobacteria bacterium]|jgi:hypothetical protein|nr:hypothetical protein [Acidobacteriota bacterium]
MKKKASRVAALLFLLGMGLTGHAQELSRYAETVTLAADGSAAIRLLLEFRGPVVPRLLVPVRHRSVRGLQAKGLAPGALRWVEKGGKRFLELDLPATAAAAPRIEIAFTVDGYFKAAGRPGPFGNRALDYRFVNVSFSGIDNFSAALALPDGHVFNAVDRFIPEPAKAGMVAPFTIAQENGRITGRITLDGIGLGDEVALSCTFKKARRPPQLLFILLALAIAYLVFYRDVLKNGKNAAAKPRP